MEQNCDRLPQCQEEFNEMKSDLRELKEALFGNKQLGQQWIVEMVKEMHSFFYPSTIILKITKNVLLWMLFVAGWIASVYKVIEIFKK